jgi:carboxyl-terminal processing protease
MNKRPYIYLPILFSLVLILGIIIGAKLLPVSSFSNVLNFNYSNTNKLNDIINYIEQEYVDSVSKNKLVEDAITGMLQNLDPHSDYIPAAEFADANAPLVGNFDGIGVQFKVIKDTIIVMAVIHDGPSQKVGLAAGDRIVKINNKNVAGIKIKDQEVMKQLKGKKGTEVTVSIYRKGKPNLIDYTITRGEIPTYSVDIAYMVTSQIGYIKLEKFSGTTVEEFTNALKTLKGKGMKKLIFDLRGNGGGYLDAAISICDQFLPADKLILYTEGYHRKKKTYYSTGEGIFENGALVILIDEMSASASEIVSGAMQDNDRATIIGRRSFGKGLVQEQSKLVDGSAIRLTVARYHTATGRCIQKPYNSSIAEYYMEFYQRLLDEGMVSDSIMEGDTLKFTTPKGKTVYGGGGIMPDIYVSSKSAEYSPYFKKINDKNLIYLFAFEYADKNRKQLNAYRSASGFISAFSVTPQIFNDFTLFCEKSGVKKADVDIVKSGELIKTYIKAFIGRNIFNDEAFYPVLLTKDKVFIKALEVINKP